MPLLFMPKFTMNIANCEIEGIKPVIQMFIGEPELSLLSKLLQVISNYQGSSSKDVFQFENCKGFKILISKSE